jgi:hypothetical protein
MLVSRGFDSGGLQDASHSDALKSASKNRSLKPGPLNASGQKPVNSRLRSITAEGSVAVIFIHGWSAYPGIAVTTAIVPKCG